MTTNYTNLHEKQSVLIIRILKTITICDNSCNLWLKSLKQPSDNFLTIKFNKKLFSNEIILYICARIEGL